MADGNANGGNGTPTNGKPDIQAWALKTVGTIIGGLGTAGAMVVIGSAVLWIRFKEAGIPAVQAVAVQPKEEALAQGAETTIFFVLAALAVVAVLYITDFRKEPKQSGDTDKRNDEEKRATSSDPGVNREIKTCTKRCLIAVPFVGIAWLITTSLGFWWVVALSALALILTWACLWIGRSESKNFWALAAAVFVAIIVFAGASGYVIVKQQKFVQAIAILRGDEDTGLTGYYVAATDKMIYFANAIGVEGTVKPEGKPLQQVALDENVTYAVGPLESQPDATARASSMLKRLIADREGKVGSKISTSDVSLPAWVSSDVAATFGASVTVRTETPETLCLMRYYGSAKGEAKGRWWMSCKEAEAQASIEDARSRFALPRRFQKDYNRRARVEIKAKTKLDYVEGDTAPQCGGTSGEPCGHRYPGGGIQYWIANPEELGDVSEECTATATDKDSAWKPCSE